MPINYDDLKSLGDSPSPDAKRSDHVAAPKRVADGENWVALCAQAAVEQDPRRLLELVKQINVLLDARRQRLVNKPDNHSSPTPQPQDGRIDGREHEPK